LTIHTLTHLRARAHAHTHEPTCTSILVRTFRYELFFLFRQMLLPYSVDISGILVNPALKELHSKKLKKLMHSIK